MLMRDSNFSVMRKNKSTRIFDVQEWPPRFCTKKIFVMRSDQREHSRSARLLAHLRKNDPVKRHDTHNTDVMAEAMRSIA